MFILLLLIIFPLMSRIPSVKASETVYIKADGSIDPPTVPISTVDYITYTFMDNISANSIVVERDNIIIDGNGYMLNGTPYGNRGFDISYRNNVTVKNAEITKFSVGMYVYHSNNCKVLDNRVTDCGYAIDVMHSSNNNTVAGNIVSDSMGGISVDYSSNNNTVSHNTVSDGGWGLYVWMSRFNEYQNNIVINCSRGIYVSQSAINNTIHHNRFFNNTSYGLDISYSYNNTISDNIVTGNYYGIHIYNSANNIFDNNTVSNSYSGIVLSYSTNNTLTSNNASSNNNYYGGRGICLYHSNESSISDNTVLNNYYGFYLEYSHNNRFSCNLVSSNSWNGASFYESSNNIIQENNITENDFGITFDYSQSNIVNSNIIAGSFYGIRISYSSLYNVICGNYFTSNFYQLYFYEATNNAVYHNNFLGPENEIIGSKNAVWDDGYPSGGNYWSDYDGTDLFHGPYQNETGSDGIGDSPYVFDENNQDNYPLMKPYPWDSYGIGITYLGVSKAVVGQGYTLHGNVMIFNYGDDTEYFNVTVLALSSTPIPMLFIIHKFENFSLASRNSSTLTFTWNTTGFAYGDYSISAYPEVGDEVAVAFVDGWVVVTIPGDVDGDFDVDLYDAVKLLIRYGVKKGEPDYDPNLDIDDDGRIFLYDAVILLSRYGQKYS